MSLRASTSPRVAHTALDFVFYQDFNYVDATTAGLGTSRDPLIFKQEKADGDRVIYDQFMGSGYFGQRTNEEAELAQGNPRVANNVSLNVLDFAQMVDVPRNFMMDNKHAVVKRNVSDMGYKGRLSQDNYAFGQWALGFTTVVTNDGTAWFSNSHTAINGSTVDNLETGVFTAGNLETLIVSLGRQVQQDGTLGYHHARLLLLPLNLLKEGTEVLDSELLAGTGNNNINYLSKRYPGLELKFSAFLDDDSTTAYFLAGNRHSCTRWVREDVHTNYISWEVSKNWVGSYQAGYREVINPISFEATVASNGTV